MYQIDPTTGDIVINGFENGVSDDPYSGIANMVNCNVVTVPKETSVNFKTFRADQQTASTTYTVDTGTDIITVVSGTNLKTRTAILFTTTTTLPAPLVAATPYWLEKITSTTFKVYTSPNFTGTQVNFTTTGTGTQTLTAIVATSNFSWIDHDHTTNQIVIDVSGGVWARNAQFRVDLGQLAWVYIGNNPSVIQGDGVVAYYKTTAGSGTSGFIFAFRYTQIDYISFSDGTDIVGTLGTWVYGWNPATGGAGVAGTINATFLQHKAIVGQDNVVYYCDATRIGSFFEKPNQVFNPTNTATFTWAQTALQLPRYESAICLAELGINLLIGGVTNAIYPWDRISTSFRYPILIGENYISRMVTVNTNTYIFAGQTGRIYITNGSQANVYKKFPDHLTGTVNPVYGWRGACYFKNQLYFSFVVSANNDTTTIIDSSAGAVWAIDTNTEALRLSNTVSAGTTNCVVGLIFPNGNYAANVATGDQGTGSGLVVAWNLTSSPNTVGIDEGGNPDGTGSAPYSGDLAYIESDLIPIATLLKPKQLAQVEYKLTKPLVNGESITLQYRLDFSQNYTTVFTDTATATFLPFSGYGTANFSNAQWVQIKAILNSSYTNPSFVRLREIRLR